MIEVLKVKKYFPVKKGFLEAVASSLRFNKKKTYVKAVNGISFTMQRGEIMGLAGESGCGKTTTGMLLLNLYTPSEGTINFEGKDLSSLQGDDLSRFRQKAQLVFQDPYESLNPRFTVRRTIEEPLIVNRIKKGDGRKERVLEAMRRSRLTPIDAFIDKFPHELSGGERQRVCIARAIVLNPTLLVADEAVSMLDVSIRAGILTLLRQLTEELEMATLYISHDLSLLGSICDRLAIMYAGEIVEMGNPVDIITSPCHPYTKALIAAVPLPEFDVPRSMQATIKGEPPDLTNLPAGCVFRPRCSEALTLCNQNKPDLIEIRPGYSVSCNLGGCRL